MEIFVIHEGEQSGPFRIFELRDKIAEGSIDVSDSGWYRGLDSWKPLHEIEALRDAIPEPDPGLDEEFKIEDLDDEFLNAHSEGEDDEPVVEMLTMEEAVDRGLLPPPLPGGDGTAPGVLGLAQAELIGSRLWPRFGARIVDQTLFLLLVSFAEMLSGAGMVADVSERGQTAFLVLVTLAWFLTDAALIATFGTTPGKLIAGLWVVDAEGNRPKTGRSLARSLLVFVFGWGFGLPLLTLLSFVLSHFRMKQMGTTFWDERAQTRVLGQQVSQLRLGLLFAIPLVATALTLALSWDEISIIVEQFEAQKAALEAQKTGSPQ